MLDKKKYIGIIAVITMTVFILAFCASAKRDAKYVGSAECLTCHEETHAAIVKAHPNTLHHNAMFDAEEKPEAIVAKFDESSPVKKEDIKYVLGVGKVYQNYLDKDLKLLPGKWDSTEGKWVAIEPQDGATQCVGCHTTNFDPQAKTWTEMGVQCEGCHGPGGAHAESMEAKDIVNLKKLDPKKSAMVCGQCHAVGADPAGKLAFSATFIPGEDLDKHFILKEPAEDSANSQYNTFLKSKHAGHKMKCTTCHDSHGDKSKAAHQMKRPVNDLCLGCHASIGSMKEHAPDAGANDTCATCHMPNGSHEF